MKDQNTKAEHSKESHNDSHHKQHKHGENHEGHHQHMMNDFRRRFWISLIASIPIVAMAPLVQSIFGLKKALSFPGDIYVQFVLAVFVFFYGGYPFLKGMIGELKEKNPGMMTLIGLAIIVAFVYSTAVVFGVPGRTFFWELATLIVVMLLGHWIEMKSVMGASRAIDELARLMPSTGHKISDDGSTTDVDISELSAGDKILIKPGEKIPADGEIYEGETAVDEAMVTGESKAVEKEKGDNVIGGSVNSDGSIKIKIEKTGEDSYLSQVMKLVKEAQSGKSRTQRLADKAAFWLTIIALVSGAITFIAWFGLAHREFVFALGRSVTVMVITCPHALGLAIPLVAAVSTSKSARYGLLIRNRGPFELARKLTAVVFDKTGTLTKGEFEVADVIVMDDSYDKKELLSFAASVEAESEHPIAKAIVDAAEDKKPVKDFQALKGKGAQGEVDGKSVKVVSPRYIEENSDLDKDKISKITEQGNTAVFVMIDDNPAGAVTLQDPIREESKKTIEKLNDMGIATMMITGDNEKVAKKVADELGLTDYFAEVLPDKKSEKIKEVQGKGRVVAMVGDGINDAPALAQADVGIAIGAGTDVAIESADIILARNNPLDVVKLIGFSGTTYKKMIQNLIWATGYNAIAIPLAAGVLYGLGILLNPAVGALLMSLSTVIVAINARIMKDPEAV